MPPPKDRTWGWVESVDAACWISGPDRRVLSMSARALDFLGRERASCVGHLCYRAIALFDGSGRPLCSPSCTARRQAGAGLAVPPTAAFARRQNGDVVSTLIWVVRLDHSRSDARTLVHFAAPRERETRLEKYLSVVAGRTPGVENEAGFASLSKRERQVLDSLTNDLTLHAISLSLDVSYATVRNHVQNILRKLDAHSIAEAVARWVLRA